MIMYLYQEYNFGLIFLKIKNVIYTLTDFDKI